MIKNLGMDAAEELRLSLREAYEFLGGQSPRVRFPQPQRFEPGRSAEGHFHLRAELFIQRQASTLFRFPSETLLLMPGELLIVPPRVLHCERVVPGELPFRNLVLYVDGEDFSCHLADSSPEGFPRIAYPERAEGPLCASLGALLEEACRLSEGLGESGGILVDLSRSILRLALRLLDLPGARAEREPLTLVRCRRMIHENLGNPELSVASLARQLGCNADYLSHLFSEERGQRLTEYIDELRMGRAAELLARGGLSCKEAAWASGYASPSYFIRRFRLRWGCSPMAYREARGEARVEASAGAQTGATRGEAGATLWSGGAGVLRGRSP
jgi:AraC-like DNA-binding protein